MWWDGNGMGGWGFALAMVGSVLFWAAIILGVIALVRYLAGDDRQRRQWAPARLPSSCSLSASPAGRSTSRSTATVSTR
jgi:putative membrane protein